MAYAKDYNANELMAVIVSRQIRNDDVVFIGVGIPLLAGILAVNTHAPDAIIVYEGGGVGARTRRFPWTISDNPTTDNAVAAMHMWRVFGDQQRGFITLGIIGGAEIDPYGNINTTVILGDDYSYERPRVRLPGSGGANDIASSAGRTVIMMRLKKEKFVAKLDHVTSPGYLTGPGAREKAGLHGSGPKAVVTEKCVFGFDEQTKEMFLQTLFPGFTVQDIQDQVGWDLKVSANLSEVEPPTEEQVRLLRAYDPMGFALGAKSPTDNGDFDTFCDRIIQGYNSIPLDLR